jgi:hypothetical protein
MRNAASESRAGIDTDELVDYSREAARLAVILSEHAYACQGQSDKFPKKKRRDRVQARVREPTHEPSTSMRTHRVAADESEHGNADVSAPG